MELKHQYDGFLDMHEIGPIASLKGILSWEEISGISAGKAQPDNSIITSGNGTFGKRMERFMSYQIATKSAWNVNAENVQISENHRTVGELDFILEHIQTKRLLHLELACKFYLYDPEIPIETARWIGPNRRDSLDLKLRKLARKQFPLLSNPATQKALVQLNIDVADMEQALSIKSMLFLPAGSTAQPPGVNPKAIQGNWYRPEELSQFKSCLWHLPEKINWAVDPVHCAEWLDYDSFLVQLYRWLDEKRSPMCWLKTPEGTFKKLFVVWW